MKIKKIVGSTLAAAATLIIYLALTFGTALASHGGGWSGID